MWDYDADSICGVVLSREDGTRGITSVRLTNEEARQFLIDMNQIDEAIKNVKDNYDAGQKKIAEYFAAAFIKMMK